ncbi:MAG: hypothetical protein FJX21_15915 [Alphaproteobacteria bacterium]|nr:hypothetical protein [Alphaproteobacteria bacterium]
MTEPHPFANRIARERWNAGLVVDGRRMSGVADWDGLSQNARDEVLVEVGEMLIAIEAAGLAVVEAEDGR